MSSVAVDSRGQRIVSDVLIAGFTHEASKLYGMTIPNEVIGVIFIFWFIDVCDEWDKSLSHESVNIVGQCAKMTKDTHCSIFGKQSINKDIFEWNLKLNTNIDRFWIGIIRDDTETLIKNQDTGAYVLMQDGLSLFNAGNLLMGGFSKVWYRYCDKFTAKDTLITVTLDMDDETIAYKIDDKQYDTKLISLSIDKYRLVVGLERTDDEIELL